MFNQLRNSPLVMELKGSLATVYNMANRMVMFKIAAHSSIKHYKDMNLKEIYIYKSYKYLNKGRPGLGSIK